MDVVFVENFISLKGTLLWKIKLMYAKLAEK